MVIWFDCHIENLSGNQGLGVIYQYNNCAGTTMLSGWSACTVSREKSGWFISGSMKGTHTYSPRNPHRYSRDFTDSCFNSGCMFLKCLTTGGKCVTIRNGWMLKSATNWLVFTTWSWTAFSRLLSLSDLNPALHVVTNHDGNWHRHCEGQHLGLSINNVATVMFPNWKRSSTV